MIMNDLELHRERELADLRMRMANSVAQFTRGLANREQNKDEKPQAVRDDGTGLRVTRGHHRKRKSEEWIKRGRSADRGGSVDRGLGGVMKFPELEKAEQSLATANPAAKQLEEEKYEAESISTSVDEIDLKAMYSYACRLMRETLDVEGVCFINIDGIDWKEALLSLYPNTINSPVQSHREFGAASSILGYSHSDGFGARLRDSWTSISRWDEESEISNPQLLSDKATYRSAFAHGGSITDEAAAFHNHADASAAGHLDDGSYVSVRTGQEFAEGGFSNSFLARFLLENSYGKVFNDGLPEEVRRFLPVGVTSAILVPIYDFEQHPFAMTCAYTTDKQKWFTPVHSRYLEVPGPAHPPISSAFRASNPQHLGAQREILIGDSNLDLRFFRKY